MCCCQDKISHLCLSEICCAFIEWFQKLSFCSIITQQLVFLHSATEGIFLSFFLSYSEEETAYLHNKHNRFRELHKMIHFTS